METLFLPYKDYATSDIILEVIAVLVAVISVLYSKNNSIKVYPTGIISTSIFVYLLYKWELFGDMIINVYYLIMSIYGWYLWGRTLGDKSVLTITKANSNDYKLSAFLFVFSTIFVTGVYLYFEKFGFWWSYVDILTTGLFFVGMLLLARRKVEHWIFLIIGDAISIPLYYYKGYTITGILFLIYTVIAIFGYLEWKKIWSKTHQSSLK